MQKEKTLPQRDIDRDLNINSRFGLLFLLQHVRPNLWDGCMAFLKAMKEKYALILHLIDI